MVSGKWSACAASTMGLLPNDWIFKFRAHTTLIFQTEKRKMHTFLKVEFNVNTRAVVQVSILQWQSVLSFLQKLHILQARL